MYSLVRSTWHDFPKPIVPLRGRVSLLNSTQTDSNPECVVYCYMSLSLGSPECVLRARRRPLARTSRDLVTRRGRARETAEERAKSWVKSARRQKAQTLKIHPLIHNDAAVLDIFKFALHFLFLSIWQCSDSISGFTNCDCLCIDATPTFPSLIFLESCSNKQGLLDNDTYCDES